jgi:hypothetical protein
MLSTHTSLQLERVILKKNKQQRFMDFSDTTLDPARTIDVVPQAAAFVNLQSSSDIAASQEPVAPVDEVFIASHSVSHSLPSSRTRAVLVSVLGCVLAQLFSNPTDRLPTDVSALSRFHTERIPSIGIADYLNHIALYGEASEEVLVMSCIHISRIHHANQVALSLVAQGADPNSLVPKPFLLNALSIHRLLLLSILCSAKFFDDEHFNNHFYAKIGGITLPELNVLEIEFLALIAFDLHIPSAVYQRFYTELCNGQLCECKFREMPILIPE